jgi:hypothetical protein
MTVCMAKRTLTFGLLRLLRLAQHPTEMRENGKGQGVTCTERRGATTHSLILVVMTNVDEPKDCLISLP